MINKTYILHTGTQVQACLQYISEAVPLPGDNSPGGGKYRRPFRVVIEPHVASKSAEQQGGFHWLCKMLGDRLGYTLGEIKEIVKERTWGADIKTGPDGKDYKFVRSSERDESGKKTSSVDYAALIEGVYMLGAEASVALPTLDKYRN